MEVVDNEASEALLNVKFSIIGFIAGLIPVPYAIINQFSQWILNLIFGAILIVTAGKLLFPKHFDVFWRAAVIGIGVSFGAILVAHPDLELLRPFGAYFIILFTFHYFEYVVTGLTNPSNLSTDSYLLNHSLQYWMAAMASWVEYFIELYFFPELKTSKVVLWMGVLICIAFDLLRKIAMFHAGASFSHIVQSTKKDDHKLVTRGVFAYFRHPSYVGWFYWSLGTQVVLSNPICFALYGYVSWLFFNERVYVEEYSLLQFFGSQYHKYQRQVPVGIPFVQGFTMDE